MIDKGMDNTGLRQDGRVDSNRDNARVDTAQAAISSDLAHVAPKLTSAPRLGRLTKWTFMGAVLVTFAAALAMLWALLHVPLDKPSGRDSSSVLVEAANGEQLGRVGPLSFSAQRAELPDPLVKAVLSIEDRRFFSHWGIDPWGIARATLTNWSAGAVVEGGSTITQQLVKIQLVGNDRTLDRKLREAFTALWLGLRLNKDEILTRYLNSVYLGAGAYGMPAAARIYFDKSLSELTLSEIRHVGRFDPGSFPIRSHSQSRCRAASSSTRSRCHGRDRRDRFQPCCCS